jgi:predicted membrane protein
MNREKIVKIIYYELIPIIIGFFLFGYLGRVTDVTDLVHKMITFLIYMIPFSLIYMWIGELIFSRFFPQDTYAYRLMIKMTKCKIRKENGAEFCVKCPDSLACIKSIDNTNKIDKIKGDVAK